MCLNTSDIGVIVMLALAALGGVLWATMAIQIRDSEIASLRRAMRYRKDN